MKKHDTEYQRMQKEILEPMWFEDMMEFKEDLEVIDFRIPREEQ